MTDREQEAREPDWDKIAQDAIDRHREAHGVAWAPGLAAAVAKAGAEWADTHRPTEPDEDVREALMRDLLNAGVERGYVGGDVFRAHLADRLLARGWRLGAEPDEDNWEYGVGWDSPYGDDGLLAWKARSLEGAQEHVAAYPTDDDGRPYYVVKRRPERSAGPWEPVTLRGEQP